MNGRSSYTTPRGWLSVPDAAVMLNVSTATVRRRVSAGALVGVVRANRTLVSLASVEEYSARQARGEVPRDLRRLRGADRRSTSWASRFPDDAYVTRTRGA